MNLECFWNSSKSLVNLCEFPPHNLCYKSFINNYSKVVELAKTALELFKDRKLHNFDPLVGENACQIRAAMYIKILSDGDLDQAIDSNLERIEKINAQLKELLIQPVEEFIGKEKPVWLECLTKDLHIDLELPVSMQIVILSYLLTVSVITKQTIVKNEQGYASTVNIEQYHETLPGLKYNFNHDLLKRIRKQLANITIDYLRYESKHIGLDSEIAAAKLQLFLEDRNIKSNRHGLKSAPCFASSFIVFHRSYPQVPILLKVQRIDRTTASSVGQIAILTKLSKEDQAVIVVEAISIDDHLGKSDEVLRTSIKASGVMKILLVNMAIHPQYSAENKKAEPPYDEIREGYRQLALKEGMCKENPRTCFVNHIFCDTMHRQRKLLDQTAIEVLSLMKA